MDYSFYLEKIATLDNSFRQHGVKLIEKLPKVLDTPNFRYHDGFSSIHSSSKIDTTDLFKYAKACAETIKDWIDPEMFIEFDVNTLEPGAVLGEHTDMTGARDAGWSIPHLHKIHFVLQENGSVTWHRRSTALELQKNLMKQGGIYVYNNYIPHKVANEGTVPRIHLVLLYNDPKWIGKYKIYDKLGMPPMQMF